jgi:hypothetical protein
MVGYDIWRDEIRLWWSRPKHERLLRGAKCRDESGCKAPPVWDRRLDRTMNGRCRMHGGLSTGSKTQEGRRRVAESNRNRVREAHDRRKRGKHSEVTQQGDAP